MSIVFKNTTKMPLTGFTQVWRPWMGCTPLRTSKLLQLVTSQIWCMALYGECRALGDEWRLMCAIVCLIGL